MPFKIGSAVSPQVMAALARRGEIAATSQGPTISRDYGGSKEGGDDGGEARFRAALALKQLEAQQQGDQLDRQERGQDRAFQRERLTAQDARAASDAEREGAMLSLAQDKSTLAKQSEARRIQETIARVIQGARKPDRMGRVDPAAIADAEEQVRLLQEQLQALGFGPDEQPVDMPAQRAPGVSFGKGGMSGSAGPLDEAAIRALQSVPRVP